MLSNTWQSAALYRGSAEMSSLADEICTPHPVPHCSTLVIFSCSRLFSHCTNSCLYKNHKIMSVRYSVDRFSLVPPEAYRDSPILCMLRENYQVATGVTKK